MARDHTNNILNYGSSAIPQHTTDLTIAAWVNPDVSVGWHPICGWNEAPGSSTLDKFLALQDGFVKTAIFDGAGESVTGNTVVPVGIYSHIGMVHAPTSASTGTLDVYLSGIVDAPQLTGAGNSFGGFDTPEISIGRMWSAGVDGAFNGFIAEICIWSAALTPAELLSLASGIHPFKIRPNSLLRYFPWYGIDSPEPDLSGNGGNITINGTLNRVNHAPITLSTPKWSANSPLIESAGGPTLLNGSVSVQGLGDLTSLPSVKLSSSASLSGVSSTSTIPALIKNSLTSISGDSSLITSPGFIPSSNISAQGDSSVLATPSLINNGISSLSGESQITTQTGFILSGSVNTSGISQTSELTSTIFGGIGSLQGIDSILTLTSEILNGLSSPSGDSLLSGSGSLFGTNSGVASASGFGDVSAIASLTANALASVIGDGSSSVITSLSLNASSLSTGKGSISSIPSTILNSLISVKGSATIFGIPLLNILTPGIANASGLGIVTAKPSVIYNSNISLKGESSLLSVGKLDLSGVILSSGISNLMSLDRVIYGGVAGFIGQSLLSAVPAPIGKQPVIVSISTVSTSLSPVLDVKSKISDIINIKVIL